MYLNRKCAEKLFKKFGDQIECIHGFDISKQSISILNKKFKKEILENKFKAEMANICDINDIFINNKIKIGEYYDIIYHINCFYFWDNLNLCGMRLNKLLKNGGYNIGGYRWNAVKNLPKHIFKNKSRDIYLNMLRKARFNMNSINIHGKSNEFQLITIQKHQ